MFNSLIHTINWQGIGEAFGNGVNTLTNSIYLLVTEIDWAGIGIAFANSVMGLVNRIDWKKMAETLSAGIRGLFNVLKNAIANIDWKQLGENFYHFLSNIDWGGIIADVAQIIGEFIAGIGLFLYGFIRSAVEDIKSYWEDKFEGAGGNIALGLLNGILGIFSGIYNWIRDHIFTPFIDGVKRLFGIDSETGSSSAMADIGRALIKGLWKGILSTPILGPFAKLISEGLDWINGKGTDFSTAGIGLGNNLKSGIDNSKGGVIRSASNVITGAKSEITGVSS